MGIILRDSGIFVTLIYNHIYAQSWKASNVDIVVHDYNSDISHTDV